MGEIVAGMVVEVGVQADMERAAITAVAVVAEAGMEAAEESGRIHCGEDLPTPVVVHRLQMAAPGCMVPETLEACRQEGGSHHRIILLMPPGWRR